MPFNCSRVLINKVRSNPRVVSACIASETQLFAVVRCDQVNCPYGARVHNLMHFTHAVCGTLKHTYQYHCIRVLHPTKIQNVQGRGYNKSRRLRACK